MEDNIDETKFCMICQKPFAKLMTHLSQGKGLLCKEKYGDKYYELKEKIETKT